MDFMKVNVDEVYKDNIYVKNHKEITELAKDPTIGDIGNAFDCFEQKYGYEHDDVARAGYQHWVAVKNNAPEILSKTERSLLKEHGFIK